MFIKNRLENQVKKSGKILNESIQDIKKLVWPNLNIKDVLMFMRFSPTWNPDLERTEIQVELTKEQYNRCVENIIIRYDHDMHRMNQCIRITPVQAQSSESKIKFNGDKELLNQFKRVSSNIKLDKIISDINNNEISVGGSVEQQKKAFTLFNAMSADKDLAAELTKLSANAVSLMQQMKDKSLASDMKKQVISDMKSVGAALKSKLDNTVKTDLTPEQQTEFDRLRTQNDDPEKYLISGYFSAVCYAYVIAHSVINNNIISIPEDITASLDEPNTQSESFSSIDKILKPVLHKVGSKDSIESFLNNIKLTGEADEQTRWIIKICNDELQRSTSEARQALQKNIEFEENKLRDDMSPEEREKTQRTLAEYRREFDLPVFHSANDLYIYMRSNNIGFITRYYNKKLNDARNNMKNIKQAISKLNSMKQKLAAGEKAFAEEKDENEKSKIRDILRKTRQDIQQLANFIPSDENGNITFDEESEKKKIPSDFTSFKTIDALIENTNKYIEKNINIQVQVSNPNLKTPCAQRRMKLFTAAERRGAELYKCHDWVIAHVPTAHAAQPFGRYRPKVDSNGQIIPECNLENWEGITPENKARRDSINGSFIKDGMSSVAWETAWCTSGWGNALRRGWDNDAGPGNLFTSYGRRYGLTVFMDCSTGYLYQYGWNETNDMGELLDECDHYSGILSGAPTITKLVEKYPSLLQALNQSGFIKNIPELIAQCNPAEIINMLVQQNRITNNGCVIISKHADFNQILPIIDLIDEIKIANEHDSDIFQTYDALGKPNIILMPVIDLGGVKDASSLFSNLIISNETLKLKNTNQIVDATSMFSNLQFKSANAEITGLDTRNVKYANFMFEGCKNTQFRCVHIPDLDFGQCESMQQAFAGSGIISINFKNNHDKVINACDAFINCFMLENMPNVLFKSIFSKDRLISTKGDYSDIFNGCSKLIKKYRQQRSSSGNGDKFDDRIDDIKSFYENAEHITQILDNRGYITVKNTNDAELAAKLTSNRNVKGIVIDKSADPEGLFANLNLKIKSLDLNGIKSTCRMFTNCVINEFGEIIGSENVICSDAMFTNTKCNLYPVIRFPKCDTVRTFFNAYPPHDIPDVQYSQDLKEIPQCGIDKINDDLNAIAQGIGQYMFGSMSDKWFKTHGNLRLVQAMYVDPLQYATNRLIQNARRDDRDFIIIDEHTSPAIIKKLLYLKPEGFVFDAEYVKSLNERIPEDQTNREDISPFFKCRASTMPVIDFNGMKNCSCFFKGCQIEKFTGFLNFSSVINTNNMFEGAQITSIMPDLDMQNVRYAEYMFTNAVLNNGFKSNLALPNAITTHGMFNVSRLLGFPFGDALELPNARDTQKMFCYCGFRNIMAIKKISMPKCENAEYMFNCAHYINYIGQLETSAANIASMFMECANLNFIGSISAPNATNAHAMFAKCINLKRIGSVKMQRMSVASDMFADCRSLTSICQIAISSNVQSKNIFKNTMLGTRIYGENGERLIARLRLLNM